MLATARALPPPSLHHFGVVDFGIFVATRPQYSFYFLFLLVPSFLFTETRPLFICIDVGHKVDVVVLESFLASVGECEEYELPPIFDFGSDEVDIDMSAKLDAPLQQIGEFLDNLQVDDGDV